MLREAAGPESLGRRLPSATLMELCHDVGRVEAASAANRRCGIARPSVSSLVFFVIFVIFVTGIPKFLVLPVEHLVLLI